MSRAATCGRLVLATAVLIVACGPGVGEGPLIRTDQDGLADSDTNPADVDSETGSDTVDETGSDDEVDTLTPPDTGVDTETEWEPGGPCDRDIYESNVVFSAETLLPGARFVSMNSDCLLLERAEADGRYRTGIVFTDPWEDDKIWNTVETVMEMRPKALTCHPESREAIVLFESDAGSALYDVSASSGTFNLLANTQLFSGLMLRGINRFMRTQNGGIDRICVFGNGIFCADDGGDALQWDIVIPPDEGVLFYDLSLLSIDGAWVMVAVGANGLILVEADDGWRALPTQTDADLLTVATANDLLTAAGQDGVIVHGTMDHIETYDVIDEDIISLHWFSDRYFKGITSEGTVFEGSVENGVFDLCVAQDRVPDGLVLDILGSCGGEETYLLMSESRVFGSYDCALIVIV